MFFSVYVYKLMNPDPLTTYCFTAHGAGLKAQGKNKLKFFFTLCPAP
jgi:hypothetical protein